MISAALVPAMPFPTIANVRALESVNSVPRE
jgi:hypothetical protein